MPPRIPSSRGPPQLLLTSIESATTTYNPPSLLLLAASRPTPSPTSAQCLAPSHQQQTASYRGQGPRPNREPGQSTALRMRLREFLKGYAARFKDHNQPGLPQYITKKTFQENWKPFPENPAFTSEPVLSESFREAIWEAVMKKGLPLKAVSAQYSVDMRRVAAVVRMKEIEKRWEAEGKPMAIPYAKAVLARLRQAQPDNMDPKRPFESVNDVAVHPFTTQQIFVPTSESRYFTREDAAKAFGDHLLPPDKRLRIPELIEFERDMASGVGSNRAQEAFLKRTSEWERTLAEKERAKSEAAEKARLRVEDERFEWRFERYNAESVGRDERSPRGVGWRYGVPFDDRKKGTAKIPTKVE